MASQVCSGCGAVSTEEAGSSGTGPFTLSWFCGSCWFKWFVLEGKPQPPDGELCAACGKHADGFDEMGEDCFGEEWFCSHCWAVWRTLEKQEERFKSGGGATPPAPVICALGKAPDILITQAGWLSREGFGFDLVWGLARRRSVSDGGGHEELDLEVALLARGVELLGFVMFGIVGQRLSELVVHYLAVVSKHRQRGFGRILLEHVRQVCLLRGVHWMKALCHSEYLGFYRALGFEIAGEKEGCATNRGAAPCVQLENRLHPGHRLYTVCLKAGCELRAGRRTQRLRPQVQGVSLIDEAELSAAFEECKEWEECLRYLDENAPLESKGRDSKMASVFALLRAKVYEVTENQENALLWYERAVRWDPYCHEALDRLVGNHFLTLEKELDLLRGLQFHEEDEWLRHLYAAKLPMGRDGTNPFDLPQPPHVVGAQALFSAAAPPPPPPPVPDADNFPHGTASGATGHHDQMDPLAGPWWSIRRRQPRQGPSGLSTMAAEDYPGPLLPPALVEHGHALPARAIRHFYEGDYQSCYSASKRILDEDPFHFGTLPVHVASLVMLDMKNVVFHAAHQLMNAYPTAAVAWFTAGCYYYMIRKYEHARRFFQKALTLDPTLAAAWIAYGHAFAHQDESDQALAAYRTATRLFPGSHLPWLFIGMEYVRTNSLLLAQQCLECARTLMPTDPAIYNEVGVVAFHRKNYKVACDLLLQALHLSSTPHETTCSNLGHAFLKCRAYDRALAAFTQADRLKPRSAPALAGIAFALQLLGRPEEAIEHYHQALTVRRDDVFASEMLSYAVQEAAERTCMEL